MPIDPEHTQSAADIAGEIQAALRNQPPNIPEAVKEYGRLGTLLAFMQVEDLPEDRPVSEEPFADAPPLKEVDSIADIPDDAFYS